MSIELKQEVIDAYLKFVLKLVECQMKQIDVTLQIENGMLVMLMPECNCKFPVNDKTKMNRFIINAALSKLKSDFEEYHTVGG